MHVVSMMVIVVVARAGGVIVVVIVGDDHSTVLTGRWAAVARVTVGIVAIPHVDRLVIGGGIAPGGRSVIDLHLPADGGRGGLFPACGLHALVLFAVAIAPARCVLLHRTWTTP